jgi:hypothetical protein
MTVLNASGLARCSQAVPAAALLTTALPVNAAETDVAKTDFAKTVTGYEARCCRAGALAVLVLGRHCGSARADFYYVLPRGARAGHGVLPSGRTLLARVPGSLTGDCPNARERAVRQRIR